MIKTVSVVFLWMTGDVLGMNLGLSPAESGEMSHCLQILTLLRFCVNSAHFRV